MARSKSSQRWLKEHFDDAFVKQAQAQGFGRARYLSTRDSGKDKLLQPNEYYRFGRSSRGWSYMRKCIT
jgi:23S rRNA (uridine2552-2'-O)-methyltransferase